MRLTPERDRATAPIFSVVIGTYNGARTLGAALEALDAQVTSYPFEVIVVNDASTDTTATIATRPGVHVVTLAANSGHGHTLNVGLREARGEYLALMDDDCVPPPDWIEGLGRAWESVDSTVTMIGGLVEPHRTDTLNRRYVDYRRPLHHQEQALSEDAGVWTRLVHQLTPPRLDLSVRSVYFTVGANMSVRVSAARAVGGFTERRGAGEEESMARPLRARFGRDTVRLFPEVVMRHDFDPSLLDTFRRSRSYGRTSGAQWARSLRKFPSTSPRPAMALAMTVLSLLVDPILAPLVVLLAPFVLYRGIASRVRRTCSVEPVVYPYVHTIEDVANNVGFVQGAWRELPLRRRR